MELKNQKYEIVFKMAQAIINLESIAITGKIEIHTDEGKFYLYQNGSLIGEGEDILSCLTNINWNKVDINKKENKMSEKLLKISCDDCNNVFYVKKHRGKRFHKRTGGVIMCPFCGSVKLYIEKEEEIKVEG